MQHRSSPSSWLLTVTLVAGLAVVALAGGQPVTSPEPVEPELREIIDRALERAAWAEEEGFETRYRRAMTQRIRQFDGDGEVTDDETLLYRLEPYQGALFSRLTARDGEPLGPSGRREQEKRWEEFQAEVADPRKRAEREREAAENEIRFDEEMVGRFTASLDGVRDLRGRPSYVISFEPRPGNLPVRRRIDHALNNSRGEAWIDRETYEIAQVSFELMDRVRLWWGILGSISNATGRLERRPVAGDVWLNTEFDVYFNVRVLFRTTRRSTTTQWSEFELAD
ncbi:MAG: hypothetical protein OXG35_19855 [Acidobacteria bacterium]|nr:hypothetical protein [Acidobacteriota bacterium]